VLRLAQDRRPDVVGLAEDRLAARSDVLAGELRKGVLGLGPHGLGHPLWHEVHHRDRRAVLEREGIGHAQGELRVRAATDRDEDPPDVARAALLDDRDVAGRLAYSLVDRRRDHRPAAVPVRARLAAPAEDHEVGFLLGGRLDDAGRGMATDPHEGVDDRALGRVVEHLLEEAPRLAGTGRALGQGHALRYFDDAERRELARPRLEQVRADADQLLRGERVRDRDEDPVGERLPAHEAPSSFQRWTRYGLSSSNSRAWRSTRSSAAAVVTCRFSMTKLPTRPK
jgi:hypothetical protein